MAKHGSSWLSLPHSAHVTEHFHLQVTYHKPQPTLGPLRPPPCSHEESARFHTLDLPGQDFPFRALRLITSFSHAQPLATTLLRPQETSTRIPQPPRGVLESVRVIV
jgi:hypothetical protein